MKKYYFFALLFVLTVSCKKDKEELVDELSHDHIYTFTVEIKSFWSAENHPNYFPENAHYGHIVGISHEENNLLFEENGNIPSWLSSYLDTENTLDFTSYYKEFQEVNKVSAIVDEAGMPATENKTFEFKTEGYNSKFSFLAKLQPSSNWFIAGNNLDLDRLTQKNRALTYMLPVFEAQNTIKQKNDAPLSIPNGAVNTFAVITITHKNSEKINSEN